jgi:hypothetical protein
MNTSACHIKYSSIKNLTYFRGTSDSFKSNSEYDIATCVLNNTIANSQFAILLITTKIVMQS